MKSFAASLIAAKNALHDKEPWLAMLELKRPGWWMVRYAGLTIPFSERATLAEASAGARILFVYESTNTTGSLIITDITGDGVFTGGAPISDSKGGQAVVDVELDTTTAPNIIGRFVRNRRNVEYSGHTWDAFPFNIGDIRVAAGEMPSIELTLGNALQIPEAWLRRANGLSGAEARLLTIYHGDLEADPGFDETFEVTKSGSNTELVSLTIGRENPLFRYFPAFIYSRRRCRWRFKDTTTCQYAGAVTTCPHDLGGCSYTAKFGAFPGIPGGYFAA